MSTRNPSPSNLSRDDRRKRQEEEDPEKAKVLDGKPPRINCPECHKDKLFGDFYAINQNSEKHKLYTGTGKIPICKACIKKRATKDDGITPDFDGIKWCCKWFDIPFIQPMILQYMQEGRWDIGNYKKDVVFNSVYNSWNYEDGEKLARGEIDDKKNPVNSGDKTQEKDLNEDSKSLQEEEVKFTNDDIKAQKDVLKLLSYDPFMGYSVSDRKLLYAEAIPYLDEDTLEDQFKISVILQILNNNNQIRKIDLVINTLSSDAKTLLKNSADIKNLTAIKNQMAQNNDRLSKENSIAVKHRGDSKAGKSTLGVMMKDLRELGFEKAEQNYYTMKLSYGMKHTADISNTSIVDILNFDSNDQHNLFKMQKELIEKLQDGELIFKEEIRKILTENKNLKAQLDKINNDNNVLGVNVIW